MADVLYSISSCIFLSSSHCSIHSHSSLLHIVIHNFRVITINIKKNCLLTIKNENPEVFSPFNQFIFLFFIYQIITCRENAAARTYWLILLYLVWFNVFTFRHAAYREEDLIQDAGYNHTSFFRFKAQWGIRVSVLAIENDNDSIQKCAIYLMLITIFEGEFKIKYSTSGTRNKYFSLVSFGLLVVLVGTFWCSSRCTFRCFYFF